MEYDFNWECTISKDTQLEFEESLREDLDRFLIERPDVHSVSVTLNWSPDDVYNEVIAGDVWCGDALLWKVKGPIQDLVWTRPADD